MLKELLAFGIVSQLPFSYSFVLPEKAGMMDVFSDKQKAMVTDIQQILFPDDGFGPGAKEISAEKYLAWVVSDPHMDPNDRQYIFDGLKWTNETSNEKMGKSPAVSNLNSSCLAHRLACCDHANSRQFNRFDGSAFEKGMLAGTFSCAESNVLGTW